MPHHASSGRTNRNSGRVDTITKKNSSVSVPFGILPVGSGNSVFRRWTAIDLALAVYSSTTAILVAVRYDSVTDPVSILGFHAFVLLVILVLPSRGAAWELSPPGEPDWKLIKAKEKYEAYPPFPVRMPVLEANLKKQPDPEADRAW